MSEPLARARRFVAVGAAALALVLVALAAAGWRLVEAETASAEKRGRSEASTAADDLLRAIARQGTKNLEKVCDLWPDGTLASPPPGTAFADGLVGLSAASRVFVEESRSWSGDLRRAALRRAMRSAEDRDTRIAVAAEGVRVELREGTSRAKEWSALLADTQGPLDRAVIRPFGGPPSPPPTRDEVLLDLFARPSEWIKAVDVVGSRDETEAMAMLAAVAPDLLPSARARRIQLAAARAVMPSFQSSRALDRDIRATMTSDGGAVVGLISPPGWSVYRVPSERVRAIAYDVLGPRRMGLVEATSASTPGAAPLPGGAWSVVPYFAESETRSRSTLLLGGLAVAGLAAIGAFAAFAVAVRRDARLATLRTEFVATVSHELRTPVAVVRTSAETLASGRATKDEDKRALTSAIVRESERLSTLVGNVLDFARMESGRRTYAKRETDVGALVRDVASRHAGVRVEIADDVPSIACDADALGAAVGNLLDNARKYSSPDAAVTARVARRGGDVVVDVEDHGIGVPDAEKPHVFERFFRGADPRVRETRGAGIGLALVEHAARAHGGRVEIVDTPGGGATFRVTLPIAQNG